MALALFFLILKRRVRQERFTACLHDFIIDDVRLRQRFPELFRTLRRYLATTQPNRDKILERFDVRQSSVGHWGALEPQLREIRQARQMREPSVADLGIVKIEHYQIRQAGDVNKSVI